MAYRPPLDILSTKVKARGPGTQRERGPHILTTNPNSNFDVILLRASIFYCLACRLCS